MFSKTEKWELCKKKLKSYKIEKPILSIFVVI
jgi:hypothetical protein